jgi:hypothetical protein
MGDLDRTDDSLLTISGLSDVEKAEVCAEIAKGRGIAHALSRLGRYMDDLDVALAGDQAFQREYEMALALRDDEIEQALHAQGVAVVVEGQHMCAAMRGVKKANARMTTSAMLGSFKHNPQTRGEFLDHVGRHAQR